MWGTTEHEIRPEQYKLNKPTSLSEGRVTWKLRDSINRKTT